MPLGNNSKFVAKSYADIYYTINKTARFSICHSEVMTSREDLLKMRNELFNTDLGVVLFGYLHDKITDYATKNLDAIEIKGMCRIIQDLKNIPEIVEQIK